MEKTFLATNLKQLRKNKKLSQERISQSLCTIRTTYAAWEEGRAEPGAAMLCHIAKYFQISVGDLLQRDYVLETNANLITP